MANKYGNSYTFMDRSLGRHIGAGRHRFAGMSYQWGRKDPDPGSSKFYDMTEPTLYGSVTKVSVAASDASTGTIANAIQNPITFLKAADWLFAGRNNYLWGNPQGEEELTGDSSKVDLRSVSPRLQDSGQGRLLDLHEDGRKHHRPCPTQRRKHKSDQTRMVSLLRSHGFGEQAWFPYNGCRYYSSGALNRGSFYYYWTSAPSAGTKSCCLAFKNDWKEVDPLYIIPARKRPNDPLRQRITTGIVPCADRISARGHKPAKSKNLKTNKMIRTYNALRRNLRLWLILPVLFAGMAGPAGRRPKDIRSSAP